MSEVPSCYGVFWEGLPGSDCAQCQKDAECLEKFSAEQIPELQAKAGPNWTPESLGALAGIAPEAIRIALAKREAVPADAVSPPAVGRAPVIPAPEPEAKASTTTPAAASWGVDQEDAEEGEPAELPMVEPGKKRGRKAKAKKEKEPAKKAGNKIPFPEARSAKPVVDLAGMKKRTGDAERVVVRGSQKKHLSLLSPASVTKLACPMPELGMPAGLSREWGDALDASRWDRERERCPELGRLMPGMKLSRVWKEQLYEVVVRKGAYQWEGSLYPTLYEITKRIVGLRYVPRQMRGGVRPPGLKKTPPWSALRFWKIPQVLAKLDAGT